ncbi:hypothetical protein Ancab_023044 [Ancistrocladus abbreviatus]
MASVALGNQYCITGAPLSQVVLVKSKVGTRRLLCTRAAVEGGTGMAATEKLGIKIERNPPESRLSELGVKQWPKWGCPPSKFPWTYSDQETCYLLRGKVKVIPDGANEAVEIQSGDLVVFPKDMSCTWDVAEAVDKHYKFG